MLAGFYYSVGSKHAPARVYHHRLGTAMGSDSVIFESGGREHYADVQECGGGRYLLATVGHGWLRTDIYLKERGAAAWQPIVEGLDAPDDLHEKPVILDFHPRVGHSLG